MKAPDFVFVPQVIRGNLNAMAQQDRPTTESDRRVREYYLRADADLLWLDRAGINDRADSLLAWLHRVCEWGMTERAFYVDSIELDLCRMRQLAFDHAGNDINRVASRLEYLLTKACERFCYGQRFGYINPSRIFNRLDPEKEDTLRRTIRYRGLFDVDMELPGADYAMTVINKIRHDSIIGYLHDIQPDNPYYNRLKGLLGKAAEDEQERIIVNMERARWRLRHPIPDEGKRIVVNIPAYQLYAYGADSLLTMRVVCGALKTKTPLLSSEVEWMEVNPQWVIPMSIVEQDVVRHTGDSAYFARNKYRIFERATNKPMAIGEVSRSMLLSGKYRVAQQSGSDNSLGRIVFRFKNQFSVFLHYTSSPWVFQRASRAISHGCVRVEHPFELAQFVLDEPDEWLLDRIRISMDMKPMTDRGQHYLATHRKDEDHHLIGYVPIKPHIPLYIIYHTLWPDEKGKLSIWPDVYGYDQVIWEHLRCFTE